VTDSLAEILQIFPQYQGSAFLFKPPK